MSDLLSIAVSLNSDEPIYVQIRDQLRVLIISGKLPNGEMLPSLRELAGQLNCSMITVRRVYSDLEREELLGVRKGIGTFVKFDSDKVDMKWSNLQVSRAFQEAVQIGRMYRFSTEDMTRMLQQLLSCNI